MHICATCNDAGYRKKNVTNKENSCVFKVRPDFSNLLKMANLLFSLPGFEFLVTAQKVYSKREKKSRSIFYVLHETPLIPLKSLSRQSSSDGKEIYKNAKKCDAHVQLLFRSVSLLF